MQLGGVGGEVHEVKSDLKGLVKRMDRELTAKSTVCVLFLGGIVLKGGFDFYPAQKDCAAVDNCVTKK